MQTIETALGRLVPVHEVQTILEDSVLRVLFDYRMSPQNPNNAPMKVSEIARAVSSDLPLVLAALDALRESRQEPPSVEECEKWQDERAFRITGSGVRFVRNIASAT